MALCRRVFTDQSWPHRLSLVGRAGMFSCVTGVDTTTISTENRELPLAKIYETFEIARVLVRLDHVASFIFGASRR